MSNEAANLVAESLLGIGFRTILINNEAYTIYPPTIKIICRGIQEWSKLNFNEEDPNKMDVIKAIPDNSTPILKGLCFFIIGDVKGYRWKSYRLFLKLRYGTPSIRPDDMNDAVKTIFDLIQGQDFFDCAVLCKSVAKMAANRK